MSSYLDMLPDDIITYIYKMLYKSIINDMKKDNKYKNLIYFNRLIEITKNPYIDTLHYYDFVISSYVNIIEDKYINYELDYENNNIFNSILYNSSLYYKLYYIKPLDVNINKIEIFNIFIYNLYKDDDKGLVIFNNTYFAINNNKGITKGINKKGFFLEKKDSYKCLAELLYYIIDFYDFLKVNLYLNIEMLEQIGGIVGLSDNKIKERDNLIDILNYHINHRYLEELFIDIEYKCAKPKLEN
jgi:hypothetical protein